MNLFHRASCFASSIFIYCLATASPAQTQSIVRDGTTPTTLATCGTNCILIEGGIQVGSTNLFHSFSQFGVNSNDIVRFNDLGVTNILSRVTGNVPSQILGTVGVMGSANLFLLNPNGISFGKNARLDIQGSFFATTASAIEFGNLGSFSASPSPQEALSLLRVNPSALLFNQVAGAITNQSVLGLQVPTGKSLLLVGGSVTLDGGNLRAPGGRVEMGGLAAPGRVGLNVNGSELTLDFNDGAARADVSITNGAKVGVVDRGSIAINARNINLSGASTLLTGASASDSRQAGDITLDATGKVNIINSFIANVVLQEGNAGNIKIVARELSLGDRAQLNTSTFGQGNAGNIFLNASDSIVLDGGSLIISHVQPGAKGKGGDINIQTGLFSLADGSQVGASLIEQAGNLPGGQGQGGNIVINSNSVTILGFNQQEGYSSGLFTATETGAIGRAGDITVRTNTFRIADGGVINAQTLNSSNGGNITIKANTFVADNGGQVLATASSSGQAGTIMVDSGSVTLSGSDSTFAERKAQFGSRVQNESDPSGSFAPSGLFANSRQNSTGIGGTINVFTSELNIRDGAGIGVDNKGTGNAGNLQIHAGTLMLENNAFLSAETANGAGGNITLDNLDLLLLRNNSRISTTAGNAQARGTGGNITIGSDLVVAIPSENSDITANAFEGSGGRISIAAQGIFGLQVRTREELQKLLGTNDPSQLDPSKLPTSDITAISLTDPQLNGQVFILTPDVDPTKGLTELPQTVDDPSNRIAQGCSTGGGAVAAGQSKFIVTGRGGLPPSPGEDLTSSSALVDLGTPVPSPQTLATTAVAARPTSSSKQLVEAQGWIIGSDGRVILTAQSPEVTPYGPRQISVNCQEH